MSWVVVGLVSDLGWEVILIWFIGLPFSGTQLIFAILPMMAHFRHFKSEPGVTRSHVPNDLVVAIGFLDML